jgi:hypothetical protein
MKKNKRGRPVIAWSKEKIAFLKKLYPGKNNKDVAAEMGITISALRNAAVKFKVKKSNRYWDKAKENFVVDNWQILSVSEIADQLEKKFNIYKTKWAIINKYRELKGLR